MNKFYNAYMNNSINYNYSEINSKGGARWNSFQNLYWP
jgi:hypothetical protein